MMAKRNDQAMDDLFAEVLDGGGMQTNSDPFGLADGVDRSIDPGSVERPIGTYGGVWAKIAQRAWSFLNGGQYGPLPPWFDEFTTRTELARRSGKTRDEVDAALDDALVMCDALDCPRCNPGIVTLRGPYADRLAEYLDELATMAANEARWQARPPTVEGSTIGVMIEADTSRFGAVMDSLNTAMCSLLRRLAIRAEIPPELLGLVPEPSEVANEVADEVADERAALYLIARQTAGGYLDEALTRALNGGLVDRRGAPVVPTGRLRPSAPWSYASADPLADERAALDLMARQSEEAPSSELSGLTGYQRTSIDLNTFALPPMAAEAAAEAFESFANSIEPGPRPPTGDLRGLPRHLRRGQPPRAGHESPNGPREARRDR